jgi:aldose 1-epimerase
MLTLEAGDVRAEIAVEAGGRLASLVVGRRELLVGRQGNEAQPMRWGCYMMAPWPGRLADGRFEWDGRTIRLPRTHGRHAIHGLVWNRPWEVEVSSGASATVSCALPPEWPMGGVVRQTMTLAADRLTLDASITAGDAMPAALGWHPWFDRAADPVTLRLEADAVLETQRMIPTGRVRPVSGVRDLRGGPVVGERRLDHTFEGARSPAVLAWPDLRLTLSFDPSPAPVVVYTPWNAVCVEPQTAPPNALALPEAEARSAGVRFLEAGETMAARLELRWDPRPAA